MDLTKFYADGTPIEHRSESRPVVKRTQAAVDELCKRWGVTETVSFESQIDAMKRCLDYSDEIETEELEALKKRCLDFTDDEVAAADPGEDWRAAALKRCAEIEAELRTVVQPMH